MADLQRLLSPDRDEYWPELGKTLTNLTLVWLDSDKPDRLQQAERAITSALAISRKLALGNPDENLPQITNHLEILARVYRETGRIAEAVEAHEEALAVELKLSETSEVEFLPRIGENLAHLFDLYMELNEAEKAVKNGVHALGILRRLAKTDPDMYLPRSQIP